MPLVSIIVPVFNTEKYLDQCIGSLVSQTMKDIEILCINDGSTDNSLHILEKFSVSDPRIKIISKPNTGYGDSMNTGLSHAQGKYIGIVESDDYALPDMFENLYRIACEKNVDIVKSNYYYATEKGIQYHEALFKVSYDTIFSPLEEREIFMVAPSIWSGLYRKSFLDKHKILFNPSPGASYQDASFSLKMLLSADRMVCVKNAYLCYRCDNANSSGKSPKKVFCIMDEFEVLKDYIIENKKDFVFPIIEPVKLAHYITTYNRIDSIYQYAFLDRMKKELQQDYQSGMMVKKFWSEESWGIMQRIVTDADAYFEETNVDYLNRYRYRDYTLNHKLANIGSTKILKSTEKIIIYGTGMYGHRALKSLLSIKKVYGFAVTRITDTTPHEIDHIPVYEINDLQQFNTESIVVVAIKKSNQFTVLQKLKELGFSRVISMDKID